MKKIYTLAISQIDTDALIAAIKAQRQNFTGMIRNTIPCLVKHKMFILIKNHKRKVFINFLILVCHKYSK